VEVSLRLAVGRNYYNSVSSLGGLDGDTLGVSHVEAWCESHGDEIVLNLSYCMSSCGTTVWALCWRSDGRVANLTYLILMENYKDGRRGKWKGHAYGIRKRSHSPRSRTSDASDSK